VGDAGSAGEPRSNEQAVDAVELLLYRSFGSSQVQVPASTVQQLAHDLVQTIAPLLVPPDVVLGDQFRQVSEELAALQRAAADLREQVRATERDARQWRRRAGRAEWNALERQPGSDVGTSDIGSMDDFLASIDQSIQYFNSGDIIEGTVANVGHDEVLLDIGYKTEGVIPRRELSIDPALSPEEVVEVGDRLEVLVLQKEDKEGRLMLSEKRATEERRRGGSG
jgi:hypothetical protein